MCGRVCVEAVPLPCVQHNLPGDLSRSPAVLLLCVCGSGPVQGRPPGSPVYNTSRHYTRGEGALEHKHEKEGDASNIILLVLLELLVPNTR